MATSRTSTYHALASESRVEILHLLQSEGELPVRAIADAVRLHTNTVREHLDRLVAAGFVESRADHRGTRGRPRLLYRAAAAPGRDSLDENFREHLMKILVAGYGTAMESPALAALEEGSRWAAAALEERDRADGEPSGAGEGRHVADDALRQISALEVHLDELGVAPEVDVRELKVHLRRCPFLGLARERTEVVCSVHLGVARGILEHEGGPVVAERLEPLVAPHHCVLHLAVRDADDGAPGRADLGPPPAVGE